VIDAYGAMWNDDKHGKTEEAGKKTCPSATGFKQISRNM
jgi:hypothetical protein